MVHHRPGLLDKAEEVPICGGRLDNRTVVNADHWRIDFSPQVTAIAPRAKNKYGLVGHLSAPLREKSPTTMAPMQGARRQSNQYSNHGGDEAEFHELPGKPPEGTTVRPSWSGRLSESRATRVRKGAQRLSPDPFVAVTARVNSCPDTKTEAATFAGIPGLRIETPGERHCEW